MPKHRSARFAHIAAMVLLGLWVLAPALARAATSYTGTWRGTWQDAATHQGGGVAFAIWDDGTVYGVVRNGAAGVTGQLIGRIGSHAEAHLRYTYDSGHTVYRGEGTLAVGPDRHLRGDLAFISPQGVPFAHGIFDLAGGAAVAQPARPQTAPSPSIPAQVAAPAPAITYTPLPNGEVASTGAGRWEWVQHHPSRRGTPAACTADWSGSGPISQICADALFAQAQAARLAGDCVSAMTDYDNAKQAAQNAGSIVLMSVRETDGRTACGNKLNPPKSDPGVTWGRAGLMPVGRYTCYSAPAVIANGGAYGNTIIQIGQWEGYIWIFDDHRYAAPYHENDTGIYRMNGTTMVALDGPYGPKRSKTELIYLAKGVYGRPTIHLAYLGDNGKPTVGIACTYDGPPPGHE